jgi:hypothetical protein
MVYLKWYIGRVMRYTPFNPSLPVADTRRWFASEYIYKLCFSLFHPYMYLYFVQVRLMGKRVALRGRLPVVMQTLFSSLHAALGGVLGHLGGSGNGGNSGDNGGGGGGGGEGAGGGGVLPLLLPVATFSERVGGRGGGGGEGGGRGGGVGYPSSSSEAAFNAHSATLAHCIKMLAMVCERCLLEAVGGDDGEGGGGREEEEAREAKRREEEDRGVLELDGYVNKSFI